MNLLSNVFGIFFPTNTCSRLLCTVLKNRQKKLQFVDVTNCTVCLEILKINALIIAIEVMIKHATMCTYYLFRNLSIFRALCRALSIKQPAKQ